MLKSHLNIVFRNVLKARTFSFINIAGLAIGMACCLLILMFVRHELGYDRFHKKADRIYRVASQFGQKDRAYLRANTPYPLAPALKEEFPQLIDAVRFRKRFRPIIQYQDKRFWEENFCLVDSTFLDVFDFEMVRGNPKTALDKPNSLVITEETSRRYFAGEDPIGKTLLFNHDTPFIVTGVVENVPDNTHFSFDFLAPIKSLDGPWDDWTTFVRNYTYILVPENHDARSLEAGLPALIQKYIGSELSDQGQVFELQLQPLTDIHLYSHLASEIEQNGHIAYVYLFSSIAVFILLLACVNFINMTTAHSSVRAREVGVRKTLGAGRMQLVGQFLSESVVFSLIALAIALGLIELFLPTFSSLTGKDLGAENVLHPPWIFSLAALAILIGFAAGSYPAWLISASQPGRILSSQMKLGFSGSRTRQILVIFQFVVSITLIACTTIVYNQMHYIQTRDLGFNKEQVVVVPLGFQVGQRAERLKNIWLENPEVVSASASSFVPTTSLWTWDVLPENAEEAVQVGTYMVDFDFLEAYGMEIIAGRQFSRSYISDSQNAFLVNETAVRRFGWKSPEEALNKRLTWAGERQGVVVGVVRDFNVSSLHEKIEPVVFLIKPEYHYISVRLNTDDTQDAMAFLKATWSDFFSHLPFDYFFLDSRFDQLHRADKRLGQIFGYFSAIAIFVAGLGLFGLSSFTTVRRTKEIGIRKVLGASTANVMTLLTKDLTSFVLLANLLAWPVAWYAMHKWLQNFAYRVDIGVWAFIVAGGIALLIALITVSLQTVRAALADPVKSLRYE